VKKELQTVEDLKTMPEPADSSSRESSRPRPKQLTAHNGLDIYNSEFTEPEALIERLLFPGLTIFVARPKVGKSWWALQIAVAIANGTMLGGCLRVRKPGKVLYLALEESQARTANRLRKLTAASDSLKNINFVYSTEALMAGGAAQIDEYLTENPGVLVVIDTFFAISKQAGRKNIDILQTDYNMINTLREICQKHACAILLIHHARKAEGDGVDVVLGTSGISAACDAIWSLKKTPLGDCVLTIRGREMEEVVHGMRLESGSPFGWRITGSGEEAALTKERREIIELLRVKGPQTPKEIALLLRKNATTVRRLLQKLVQEGFITKDNESYSVASDEGLE
jgi:hypothetical protein